VRIVIVKPIIPWPPTQGTRRVTMGLLRALAPAHEVTLVAPSLDRADIESAAWLEKELGIRVITTLAPNRKSIFHRIFYRAAFGLGSLVAIETLGLGVSLG